MAYFVVYMSDAKARIVGSSNGRTTGFGPVYLGSSPSPTAKLWII